MRASKRDDELCKETARLYAFRWAENETTQMVHKEEDSRADVLSTDNPSKCTPH